MKYVGIMLVVASLGATAQAQEIATTESRFGQAGAVVPSGEISYNYNRVSVAGNTVNQNHNLNVAPGVMVFLVDNLALGASLQFGYDHNTTGVGAAAIKTSAQSYGVAPALAYNIDLSQNVSLFPKVSLGYNYVTAGAGAAAVKDHTLVVGGDVPVLYHVGHFFVGVGPRVAAQVWTKNNAAKTLDVGVGTTIGGVF